MNHSTFSTGNQSKPSPMITDNVSALRPGLETASAAKHARRRHDRYGYSCESDWDFFTSSTGTKEGFIENLSEGGCLLRTTDPIEHRRWIRLVVREPVANLCFTAVGRVIRREDRMELWDDHHVTLHRYGVEFIHPLNAHVLERVRGSRPACSTCGEEPGTIADLHDPQRAYCVLCHLRQACDTLVKPGA